MRARLKAPAAFLTVIAAILALGGFVYPNPPAGTAANNGQDLPDPAMASMRMLDTNPSASWLIASQSNGPGGNMLAIPTLPFDAVNDAATGSEFECSVPVTRNKCRRTDDGLP
jgi:hypothetical protein